ncbi:MAG: hypothetical protein MRERV_52c006 [Mycoplasmataceae bacterium RV_VA103A]|nr:MAG: hypothetical protein MRERV_52c006 [Mycoplasmataceae bacterium RV_VA103A]
MPDKGGNELKDWHMGVIISNNRQNQASPLIITFPITSLKEGSEVYSFEVETFINNQSGKILVDQITTTDKAKRIGKFIGQLDEKSMLKVERAVMYWLFRLKH